MAPMSPIFKKDLAERFEFPDVMVSGKVYTVYVMVFKVLFYKEGSRVPFLLHTREGWVDHYTTLEND